jgi:hypothetical protein
LEKLNLINHYLKQAHAPGRLTAMDLSLPPQKCENMGAGLEPQRARLRRGGKPFRRDPAALKAWNPPILPYIVPLTQKDEASIKDQGAIKKVIYINS